MGRSGAAGRAGRWVALVVVVAVAAAGGWWAARETVAAPAGQSSSEASRVVVAVTEVSVGQTFTYNATVTQPLRLIATNALAGVVTRVSSSATFGVGDELYAVAGTPVRAVVGDQPFYRDMVAGMSGEDVRALQQALVTLGHLRGGVDGVFGSATTRAVRSWQKATGQPETGTVRLGELVAVATLPAELALDEGIVVGGVLAGGEPAVRTRAEEPSFALVLTSDQAARVPTGARVEVVSGDLTWSAVVTTADALDTGLVSVRLTAPDGTVVCGADCATLPAQETVTLTARVEIVPQVTGPGVPAAAVRTDAGGSAYVTAADGTQVPVSVLGSGDGLAVLSGVEVGDEVVVLGDDETGTGSTPTSSPTD